MRSLLVKSSCAAILGALLCAPGALAETPDVRAPVARAAGGDVVALQFPSLVAVRLARTQTLLDRAARFADEGQSEKALVSLGSSRANLRAAWAGAKYVIENAPPAPPVAGDGAFHRSSFRSSGRIRVAVRRSGKRSARSAQTAAPNASIYDTAFAVLGLQHAVATTAVGLIDTSHGLLLAGLSTTIFTALNGRDEAVAYIHGLPVPPPVAGDGAVTARAAGAPVAGGGGWAAVMPGVTGHLDDELQQIDATQDATTIRPGAKKVLGAAEVQDIRTERKVNLYWPALPADD